MKKPFNIIVAGSRNFSNYQLLKKKLDALLVNVKKTHKVNIVSGRAKGADKLGEKYASENNLGLKLYPADWEMYGNKAGFVRNNNMAKTADALVVFWDGKSKGTHHMIKIAQNLGIKTRVIMFPLYQ